VIKLELAENGIEWRGGLRRSRRSIVATRTFDDAVAKSAETV
jgi:hypothetical protein